MSKSRRTNKKEWRGRIPTLAEVRSLNRAVSSEAPPSTVETYQSRWSQTVSCLRAYAARVDASGVVEVPADQVTITPRDIAAINELLSAQNPRWRFETCRKTIDCPRRYRLVVESSLQNSPVMVGAIEDTHVLCRKIGAGIIEPELSLIVCVSLWKQWLRMSYFEGAIEWITSAINEQPPDTKQGQLVGNGHVAIAILSYFIGQYHRMVSHGAVAAQLGEASGDDGLKAAGALAGSIGSLALAITRGDENECAASKKRLESATCSLATGSVDRFLVGLAFHSLGGADLIGLQAEEVADEPVKRAIQRFESATDAFDSSDDPWYTMYSRSASAFANHIIASDVPRDELWGIYEAVVRQATHEANHRILVGTLERMGYLLLDSADSADRQLAASLFAATEQSRVINNSPQLPGFFSRYHKARLGSLGDLKPPEDESEDSIAVIVKMLLDYRHSF